MKKIALFCLVTAVLGAADFQTGLDAFKRGDFATALHEWQPIADAGDPHAQYNLGLLYARGQGVAQDYRQAASWYQKAAEQGVAAAQYNLGVMYANGQGVPASPQDASKWFLKAAEQGVIDAANGLGRMYYEGEGAFRNYGEAEKWYRKAADQGVASAAFNLGVMYDLGQGVPKDYTEALKWYRKAADEGYAGAMANIGILYYNAQGVKRDLVEAYAWFARAQKLGDPRAGELLSAASNKLKPGDLKKAQTQVAQWQPPAKRETPVVEAQLFKPRPEPKVAAERTQAEPAASQAQQTPPAPPAATPSQAPAPAKTPETAPATPQEPPSAKPPHEEHPAVWEGVERIVAVGDVHGDYEQFAAVLASAGLIDGSGDWTGGKTHLVQNGDVVDRGPDSRAVMDLLMKLEKQAAAAGGAVHALIGNHEAMNVYGDLRYVSPGEFASYTHGPDATRDVSFADRAALSETANPSIVRVSVAPAERPAGFAEHRAAFAPDGVYGRWIRGHDAVIKIDRTLFVHGGLGAKYADWTIDRINGEVRAELNDFTRLHGGIVTDEEGPLWYRDLATGDEERLAPLVDDLLQHFDVDRIVIGHSYAQAAITPRFGGKVVLIDIGLSRVYDNIGKMGCLEIKDGKAVAIHRGQRLELPKDESGPDMLRYLKEAAALDPPPSPLLKRIADLAK